MGHLKGPQRHPSAVLLLTRALPLLLVLLPLFLVLHLSSSSSPSSSSSSFSSGLPAAEATAATNATGIRQRPTSDPAAAAPCDYSDGRWVPSSAPLLYNGSTCAATIKAAQNCMAHGRPDTAYLRYRWLPASCPLPRFRPAALLRLLRHRHLLFAGDSLARNQLESLLCLLSSRSPPVLVDADGRDGARNRRWRFPSHNLTVSLFWSPFLVRGVEKSPAVDHNELHLHAVDERWASAAASADVVVLSVGHWFLHRAVYLDGAASAGCHAVANCTEVEFFGAFARAFRTALAAVVQRRARAGSPSLAVVTTFSPAHFEGEWDKLGACARTEPDAGATVGWTESEMRRLQVGELEEARASAAAEGVSLEVLDVTRMAAMRPDGHPGAYMYAFPFREGVRERVQNDCVHWCMPGPIDAWNEILLQIIRRWKTTKSRD